MGIKVTKTEGSGSHVDPGAYKAMLMAITEQEPGQYGPWISWQFKIKDPMDDGEEIDEEVLINGPTSMKWGSKSKMEKWLKAMGIDPETGDTVDLDDALGSVVMVTIVDNPKDDIVYSKIVDVNPIPKRKSKGKKKEEPKKASKKSKEDDEAPPDTDDDASDDDNSELFDDF